MAVPGIDRVVVATDDDRIAEAARGFGAEVVMTSDRWPQRHRALRRGVARPRRRLRRGRQPAGRRAADAAVVRLGAGRGDAGAIPTGTVATPVLRCDAAALAGFLEDRRHGRVGATTAVFDRGRPRALLLEGSHPLHRTAARGPARTIPVFHHVGVYAYRHAALAGYPDWPVGPLETWEGLEQLRFMENGADVHCVDGGSPGPRLLGTQQSRRRAAHRGDPARARHCR